MKPKILLLVTTLAAGALLILAAQLLPEYKDELFIALPFLAVLYGVVLMVMNSRRQPGVEGEGTRQERARRRRIKNITAVLLGLILLGALAMILYLPGEFIAIPIVLVAVVCVGSIVMAFWLDRPVTGSPDLRERQQ